MLLTNVKLPTSLMETRKSMARNHVKTTWNGKKLREQVQAEIDRRLTKVGGMLVKEAKQDLSRGNSRDGGPSPAGTPPYQFRGRLAKSVTFKFKGLRKTRMIRVGTRSFVGYKQEVGGVIRPKSKKALAVPISLQARRHRGGARNFPIKLTMIKRRNKPPLLVDTSKEKYTKKGKLRKNSRWVLHYVLTKKVTLPKRPWLRPLLQRRRRKIFRMLAKPGIFRGSRGIKAVGMGDLSGPAEKVRGD